MGITFGALLRTMSLFEQGVHVTMTHFYVQLNGVFIGQNKDKMQAAESATNMMYVSKIR